MGFKMGETAERANEDEPFWLIQSFHLISNPSNRAQTHSQCKGIYQSFTMCHLHFFLKSEQLSPWILAKRYLQIQKNAERTENWPIIVKWSIFTGNHKHQTTLSRKWTPRFFNLYICWISSQRSTRKPFEVKYPAEISFMVKTLSGITHWGSRWINSTPHTPILQLE